MKLPGEQSVSLGYKKKKMKEMNRVIKKKSRRNRDKWYNTVTREPNKVHQTEDNKIDFIYGVQNETEKEELTAAGGWTLWRNAVVVQKERDYFQVWQICDNQNKAKHSWVEKALKSSHRQWNLFEEL